MPAKLRTAAAALVAVAWLIASAAPVSAHAVSGAGATNWQTRLIAIAPRLPGLSVKVVEGGNRIEVTNHGPEVTIFGYDGEPYLRVGPAGLFENARSPSTYLNCGPTQCPLPPQVDTRATEHWVKISSGQTALWYDHRAHWMGGQLPPAVARAPNQVHVQGHWKIAMAQGATSIAIIGDYTWLPGQSALPWLLLALALMAGGVALGSARRWGALAVAVGLVTLNDLYHAAAVAWFSSGSTAYRTARLVSGSELSAPGWVLGAAAAWLIWRRRVRGLYAAIIAGVSAAVATGLLDINVLFRSQTLFDGSSTADRLTVTISLGLGIGVALAALTGIRAGRADAGVFPDEANGSRSEGWLHLGETELAPGREDGVEKIRRGEVSQPSVVGVGLGVAGDE